MSANAAGANINGWPSLKSRLCAVQMWIAGRRIGIMENDKELRELDAYLAEHVMGFHRQQFDNGHAETRCNVLVTEPFRADRYRKHGFNPDPSVKLLDSFPRYSTDRASAMSVLEKCLEKTSTASIEIYQGCDEPPEYRKVFGITLINYRDVVMAETLPLTICKFAKKLFTKP